MAKNTVYDWSTTAANNTDIGGIGITGASSPSNLDDAEREMMAQIKSWATSLGLSSGDQVARLGSANTFTANQTISGTGPTLTLNDTSISNLQHNFLSFNNFLTVEADANNVDPTAEIRYRIGGSQVASTNRSGHQLATAFTTDAAALSSGATYNGSGIGIGFSAGAAIFSRSGGPAITLNRVGTSTVMSIRSNATEVGTIAVTASATAYNTSSDYRLKYDVVSLTGSGAFIDALRPRMGNWVVDDSRFVGFIAHEFAVVSPASVTGEKDAEIDIGTATVTIGGQVEIIENVTRDEVPAEAEWTKTGTRPVMQSMQASSPEVMANIVAELQSLRLRVSALEA